MTKRTANTAGRYSRPTKTDDLEDLLVKIRSGQEVEFNVLNRVLNSFVDGGIEKQLLRDQILTELPLEISSQFLIPAVSQLRTGAVLSSRNSAIPEEIINFSLRLNILQDLLAKSISEGHLSVENGNAEQAVSAFQFLYRTAEIIADNDVKEKLVDAIETISPEQRGIHEDKAGELDRQIRFTVGGENVSPALANRIARELVKNGSVPDGQGRNF